MKKENSFDNVAIDTRQEKFYLVEIAWWAWSLTEDVSLDEEKEFYDYSPGGRLFESSPCKCPICEGYELFVSASVEGCIDWHCRDCDTIGYVHGAHGESVLIPKENGDDEYHILPQCIVISHIE